MDGGRDVGKIHRQTTKVYPCCMAPHHLLDLSAYAPPWFSRRSSAIIRCRMTRNSDSDLSAKYMVRSATKKQHGWDWVMRSVVRFVGVIKHGNSQRVDVGDSYHKGAALA